MAGTYSRDLPDTHADKVAAINDVLDEKISTSMPDEKSKEE